MASRKDRLRRREDAGRGDDFAQLMSEGAKTRRHRYFRDLASFGPACLIAILAMIVIYIPIDLRSTQPRWWSILEVCVVLCGVPVLSAFTLTAFRRMAGLIFIAVVVTAIYYSFAVTLLSALRVPVSYLGLACVFPAVAAIMAVGNLRFQSALYLHAAVLDFKGDAAARALLVEAGVTIIEDPEADIEAFDVILIEPSEHHSAEWSDLLALCYLGGIEIMPWSQFLEVRLGRVDVSSFDLSRVQYSPSQVLYARIKRFLEMGTVIATLPFTLVLAALVAAYIFLRDGGPVIFVQHRLGIGERPIRVYKFRTMYKNSDRTPARSKDHRIIPGCGFIRKARLDELPQLYNVLIGNMSLIGPRPSAVYLARLSVAVEPKYNLRTLVLPGLTGWAQVKSGYATNTEQEMTKLAYDLYYIKHLSLDLDLQIIFKTVRTVLLGVGAR